MNAFCRLYLERETESFLKEQKAKRLQEKELLMLTCFHNANMFSYNSTNKNRINS